MAKPKAQKPVTHVYIEIEPATLREFKGLAATFGVSMQTLLGKIITFWVKHQK